MRVFEEAEKYGYDCSVEFILRGKTSNVVIRHFVRPGEFRHVWNVYAIITKRHKLYDILNACYDYNDAHDKMGFDWHGGVTFFENYGQYIKIGDDYVHAGDDLEERSLELPKSVRDEAEALWEFLNNFTAAATRGEK